MLLIRRLALVLCVALLAGCAAGTHQAAGDKNAHADRYTAADTSRTIDLTSPPADAWDRIRRGFAIPNLKTDLVQQWTDYYAAHPQSVQNMAARAGKYLYYVVDEINRRGLPTELALLPFVESAYDPSAYSRAKAAGLWQFVPSTGRPFNLKQDWWRDERRDPIASTNAALDYLEYLFDFQGDWSLALASYNWGEGSVRRAIAKNQADDLPADYLSLKMPDETRNYVPKLQAIKNIIADPEKYAVVLPQVDNTPYFEVIPKTRSIDVALAAKFAQMPIEEFQALNPAFNRPIILAEHNPKILLPRDRVAIYQANLKAYDGDLVSWTTYRAKRGESLAAIAKRHGISESELRDLNDLPGKQRTAQAGDLLVPSKPGQGGVQIASLQTPSGALSQPAQRSTNTSSSSVRNHKVRSGDTLYALARRYGTTVANLRALNNLRGTQLKVGTRLRVPGTGVRG